MSYSDLAPLWETMFMVDGMSTRAISRVFGCGHKTVARRLRKRGCDPSWTVSERLAPEWKFHYCALGRSGAQIGEVFSRDHKTILSALKAFGIDTSNHLGKTLRERFWEKVDKTHSCWLWKSATQESGHGVITIDGQQERAHRVSVELSGKTLPNDKQVNHHCDVPNCVRPDHLYVGTQQENVEDWHRRGHGNRGESNGQRILTAEEVRQIRARYVPYEVTMSDLGAEFGISQSHVSDIIHRKAWKHV